MNKVERASVEKLTYYNTTDDKLLDILFNADYFEKHLLEVHIGNSDKEKMFAMFVRDPRYGLGRRDLGRRLMKNSEVSYENIVKAGRYDDLIELGWLPAWEWWIEQAKNGDELAKKWLPRLQSKHSKLIKRVLKRLEISEQEYRKIIKCDTVENKLSHHRINEIDFNHVPSSAMIKYRKRFMKESRFKKHLKSVKKSKKKLNSSDIDSELFKSLESSLNNEQFLNNLLSEYSKNIDIYPF